MLTPTPKASAWTASPRSALEQIENLLDGNGLGLGHFGKYPVKCADLERIVKWNGDRMDRRSLVK